MLWEACKETYTGDTGRKLVERTDEHRWKDKNLHEYQHSVNLNHVLVALDDFTNLIPDTNIANTKEKFPRVYLLKAIVSWTFLMELIYTYIYIYIYIYIYLFIYLFTFDINFPKSSNISG